MVKQIIIADHSKEILEFLPKLIFPYTKYFAWYLFFSNLMISPLHKANQIFRGSELNPKFNQSMDL